MLECDLNITGRLVIFFLLIFVFLFPPGPMIENILAVCPSREERQQWIEYLSQEQRTNMTKSPTTSHVSYSSLPYVRLSKYFAKLVRRKIIYTDLLKKLLYFQYIFKPDLSNVKMRKCTVTYTIYPSRYDSHSDEGSTASNSLATRHEPRHKSSLKLDVTYKIWEHDDSRLEAGYDDGCTESTSSFICHDLNPPIPDNLRLETSRSVPNITLRSMAIDACPEVVRSAIEVHDTRKQSPIATGLNVSERVWKPELLVNCKEEEDCDCLNSTMRNWKRTELFRRKKEINEENEIENSSGVERGPETGAGTSNEVDYQLPQFHNTTPRSSDSGMADSYHLNSSDLNSSYKSYRHSRSKCEADALRMSHSESENDENKFEHQCICTSPFGSTPRESLREPASSGTANTAVTSASVSNLGFENLCRIRPDVEEESAIEPTQPNECKTVTSELVIRGANQKHFSEPIPCRPEKVHKKSRRGNIHRRQCAEEQEPEKIYTSGLYAHWWLKKKIPMSGNTEQGKLPWHGCFTIHNHNNLGSFTTNYYFTDRNIYIHVYVYIYG